MALFIFLQLGFGIAYFVFSSAPAQLNFISAYVVGFFFPILRYIPVPFSVLPLDHAHEIARHAAAIQKFSTVAEWQHELFRMFFGSLGLGVAAAVSVFGFVPSMFFRRGPSDVHVRGARVLLSKSTVLRQIRIAIGLGLAGTMLWWSVRVVVDATLLGPWYKKLGYAATHAVSALPGMPNYRDILLDSICAGLPLGLFAALSLWGVRKLFPTILVAGEKSIVIGTTRIPTRVEPSHFLVCGRTSAGKTQAIQQMLRSVREREDRVIVADPDGSYLSRFWRQGDKILNPFDERSARWSPFSEIRGPSDCQVVADAIVPPSDKPETENWLVFARVLLAAVLRRLYEDGRSDVSEVLKAINSATDEELEVMLAGTAAAGLRRHDAMFHSILGVLTPLIQPWEHLVPPDKEHPAFSIREWVRSLGGSSKGWLFITYRDDQLPALRHLIATWMSLAITQGLSLPPDLNRRIWYVMDELDSLGKVASLRPAATKLRKHGGVVIAGLQTIAQLRSTYGHNEAQVLLSSLATKLILACGDNETAAYFQDELGNREVERQQKSTQTGKANSTVTSSESVSMALAIAKVVMASELTGLADRKGYLRLSGSNVIQRVDIPLVEMHAVVPPFCSRG